MRMVKQFGQPRLRHAELTQRDMDLAASLQKALEKAYFHALRYLYDRTRVKNLCLAGGVALNSVANGKIFEQTPFERIYTQPAAGDDGTAVGVAFYVHNVTLGQPTPLRHEPCLRRAFLRRPCHQAGHRRPCRRSRSQYVPAPDLFMRTAHAIARGDIVGWFQDGMEWGPRALGNRSIIAHPGLPDMKNTLNSRIKHREWFRPFARRSWKNTWGSISLARIRPHT